MKRRSGCVLRTISLSREADEKLLALMERLGLGRGPTITRLVEWYLSKEEGVPQ